MLTNVLLTSVIGISTGEKTDYDDKQGISIVKLLKRRGRGREGERERERERERESISRKNIQSSVMWPFSLGVSISDF